MDKGTIIILGIIFCVFTNLPPFEAIIFLGADSFSTAHVNIVSSLTIWDDYAYIYVVGRFPHNNILILIYIVLIVFNILDISFNPKKKKKKELQLPSVFFSFLEKFQR